MSIEKRKVKTPFLNISIGSLNFSQTKQIRRCVFFLFSFFEILPSGNKKKKRFDASTKDFFRKFPKTW